MPKSGTPRTTVLVVDASDALAEQRVLVACLELQLGARRHRELRGVLGELAVAERVSGSLDA